MLKSFKRRVLFFLAGALLLSPVLTIVGSSAASAAQSSPQDQLERWLFYRGMRACLENPWFGGEFTDLSDDRTTSVADINKGHLKIKNHTTTLEQKEGFGYLAKDLDSLDGSDGTVECSDGSIWVSGAHIFGFDNVINLICAMNNALDDPSINDGGRIDPRRDGGKCEDAQEVYFDGGGGSVFQRALTKALESPIAQKYGGDGDRPSFNFNDNKGDHYTYLSLLYLLGKNSLETFCGGSLDAAKANNSYDGDKYGVSVYVVKDGAIAKSGVGPAGFSHTYTITNTELDDESDTVNDVYYSNGGNSDEADDRSCGDMARWTREGARDYEKYEKWAIAHKDVATEDSSGSGDGSGGDPSDSSDSSCNIDGIGWIICPTMNFIGTINDLMYNTIDGMLKFDASKFADKDLLAAWSTFRNIANILFVLAFLLIIYSQMTGMGVTNYGLKKLLPKLIVAAILVNISFWLCAIAVDISNILGASLKSFFDQLATSGGDEAGGTGIGGVVVGALVTSLLAAGLVAAAAGAVLAVSVPVLLAAALAIIMIIVILLARQALLIILIVISPVAFVAYLLPNTEQWFKKWMKLFGSLLMLYPVVAVVFGASAFAGRLISNTAGDDYLLQLTAIGVATLPLIFVPSLLKSSMNATGTLGAKLSGLSNMANKRVGKKVKDTSLLGAAKQAYNHNQSRNNLRRVSRATTGSRGRLLNRVAPGLGQTMHTQAQNSLRKLEAEELDVHSVNAKEMSGLDLQRASIDPNGTAASRTAASLELLNRGEFGNFEAAWNHTMDNGSPDDRRRLAEAVAKSSNKPSFLGQGTLGAVARGENTESLQSLATSGATRYSAEDVASASNEELSYVWGHTDTGGQQHLVYRAHEALTSPEISKSIGNNRQSIENIRHGSAPPQRPNSTPPPPPGP